MWEAVLVVVVLLLGRSEGTYVRLKEAPFCFVYEVVTPPDTALYITYGYRPADMPPNEVSHPITSVIKGLAARNIQLQISWRAVGDWTSPGGLARPGLVREATLTVLNSTIEFIPGRQGSLEVCFTPSVTSSFMLLSMFRKVFHPDILLEVDISARGHTVNDRVEGASSVKVATSELDAAHGGMHYTTILMKEIRDSIKDFNVRLLAARATAESSFTRVWSMMILTVGVAGALAAAQYYALTRFLKQRKLV